ncbi:MAG: queuosine precursor transporter [Bacteroidetes bacterium]|jgi:uncharacterized integral membrane protein (TIGR00697 family)|nr:queuosine precursor transporter [Bacteroidota bacterium]
MPLNPFSRANTLYLVLGGLFITSALLAEFLGAKLFSLEATLGLQPLNLKLLGQEGMGFTMTAGVLLWPVVFVITDLLNEYYGQRGVRRLSFLAAALIAYGFAMVFIAMQVAPAPFWQVSKQGQGVPDMHAAYNAVFGQGLRIIVGSLVAFLVGQLVDVVVFTRLKRLTSGRYLWLRATGSTLVSQLIDSYVVLFIAFYGQFPLALIMAIGMVNYAYKFVVALASTPVIYLAHRVIEMYLAQPDDQAPAPR